MRSPFTGLRFARLELDNFRAGTMIKLALCAIALIPLIYAGLFLLAFLDPYGSLVNVPAVVVNQDKGDKIDGEERNVGQELCDELVKNNENRKEGEASGYNWKFVNDEEGAKKGLDDGTYYMELIIPENFTEAIASADTKSPERAELQAYFNPSTNLIAQTVGSSMVTKIRAELNYKVGKEYYDNIFLKIDDAADQIQEAVDGSDKLADGMGTLEDGSGTLTDGLETAKDGSDSLESGLGQLETGSGTLTDGLKTAKNGSDQLASGSKKLEAGSETLGNGIDSAKSGAGKLENGAKSAKSGSDQLESGAKSLSDGAKKVDEGVGTLSSSLKQLQDGIATAKSGTATLSQAITGVADALTAYQSTQDASYLTTATQLAAKVKESNATIGDDLYTYVASLTSKLSAYQKAAAQSASAQKEMQEKQQAMEKAQTATAEPTKTLEEKAKALQGDLSPLATAAGTIQKKQAAGAYTQDPSALVADATALAKAAGTVVSGDTSGSAPELLIALNDFQDKLETYQSAAKDYQTAAAAYQTAATAEATAGADAKEAQGQITGYLTGVKNASAVASSSTDTVSSAIDQLYTAVSGDLKTGTSQLASGAETLATGTVSLGNGIQAIQTGEHSLVVGLGKLQSGNGTITKSLGTAATGASSLSSGLANAVSGSGKITTNLGTAKDGAGSLSNGLSSAVSGSNKITTGMKTAKTGAEKLHDGLKDGKTQLEKNVQNKKQKAKMMSQPVTANGDSKTGESITQVKNYGTGFAPYFISLGMWVGALMISMVMNVLNRRILMSGASSISAVLASYFPMLLVSFVQVVLLLLVIQFGLHMEVKYPAAFYLFGLLTSICFIAIIQFFRASMGTTGMVVIVVLLMLQLCTAAGTFPIEAELPVFNVLNPFLPMTYVVHGFRMCMAGLSLSYIGQDIAVLLAFAVAFLFFTVLWARHRRTVTMTQLYPPLKLSD